MGLDMYLKARRYVGGWDHAKPAEKARFRTLLEAFGENVLAATGSPSGYAEVTVAYWRKANAIHRWFVEHVQDGSDNCEESNVSKEQLASLVELCKKTLASIETVEGDVSEGKTYHADGRVEHHTRRGAVIAQKGLAANLLPTQEGFFFGKTDYDEDYLSDLHDTIRQLEPLRTMSDAVDFYYQASW